MHCLVAAKYNMTFDVMRITVVQKDSGALDRAWTLAETGVPGMARGIQGQGVRVVGSTERWSDTYSDVEVVKLRTQFFLTKRDRVTNIRAHGGEIAWKEDSNTATKFEVLGSTPVLDPWGSIVEYDIMLQRAENQK